MFRTKKDVDQHVKDIFRKLTNENEKNVRCYNIAKLYYQVGDYESARRYVSSYLEVRQESAVAHKLLGQIREALGQKEAALAQYKISLELDGRQEELVLKVCELLADMELETDVNKIRYWVERADKLYPHHPLVFQLKEKLLTVGKPNENNEDLEALIASELSARPTDVTLRVKLLKHYMSKNRLDDAYKHACQVEETHGHRNSVIWYQTLSELLTKCKEKKQSDWSFWIMYVATQERYVALSLKEQDNDIKKTVPEAIQAVFNFDQNIMELKKKNFANNTAFTDSILLHMWGQLNYHLACLLLRKTKREQGNWAETGKLCAPLFLTALHVAPMDPTSQWAVHLKDSLKNQIRLWYREGSYRCSQSGHVLKDYARDETKKLMDRIDRFCISSWRERVYQRIFVNRMYQQCMGSSYFTNSNMPNPPLRLCSNGDLKQYDEVSEEVWPDSFHHQVWLGIKSKPVYSYNKDSGPHPHAYSHVFPQLQFSVYNLNQAAPDSLSRLDIDAFLNAAVLCASVVIEEQQLSGFLSPDKLPTLPADLTNTLCTSIQEEWWESAYKMYCKPEALDGDIGKIRQELQHGLEVVRCIGNHGLHPTLLVHLGRIFNYRAKILKEKDKKHNDIPALEARSELYWSTAMPLLERLQSNQIIRMSNSKLFNYQGKEMSSVELSNVIEEGKLLLVQRFLRDKQYEDAIEVLQPLKCPEASFQQGQIYKILADELVSSMSRESLTSELRSRHVIMLAKARNCYYLTLDRLRSPGVDPKHPLNSELGTHISNIENELKRIDPDISRGDLNRNDCDGMSDENYSSAHSGIDQPVVNPVALDISASINTLHTPQKGNARNPKRSSTPFKPQNQDVLDLTRNRTEARPSPERLDAQIRQMIHSRDNLMQTIIEQNKTIIDSNKLLLEKIGELRKEMTELRKDNQKQQPPSLNINSNLEEDLYVLGEEDYGDLNYRSNQTGAGASSISGNFLAQSHNQPYSPMVYPSATFPTGYYQQGIPLNQYPPSVYQMPTVLSYHNQSRIPDNLQLQQGIFNPRLQTRLPDMLPPVNQLHMPLPQKIEISKTDPSVVKDVPTNKEPPVNVVITTSDTLPTTVPPTQPTLSVTIPVQYRATPPSGSTLSTSEPSNAPHNYQISMPEQATIPTTVNLPPLSTTFTTTTTADTYRSEISKGSELTTPTWPNKSNEVVEQEHDPIPDFVPLIPLPAEVKVTTGEEGETTLYCARAKLFRFVDKEWKERGIGNVKLLRNEEGKVRLLMRRDCVLKICANHLLRPDMELTPMPKNDKAWIWVANDFADEEVKLEKLCIRFKTSDEARSFKEHFDKARLSLPKSPDKINEPKSTTTSSETFAFKSAAQKLNFDQPAVATENITPQKSKDTTMLGGFSFTSKPIIQEKPKETTKGTPKTEEVPKVGPFSGFSFTPDKQSLGNKPFEAVTNTPPSGFTFPKPASSFAGSPIVTTTPAQTVIASPQTTSESNTPARSLRRPHNPPTAVPSNIIASVNEAEISDKEIILFKQKVNLSSYVKDPKQSKDKGMGQMKILLHKETGQLRLLMHTEDSRVCYNHRVTENVKFVKNGTNNVVNWIVKEQGKPESKPETFSAVFENPEHASQFVDILKRNQNEMSKGCVSQNMIKKQGAGEKSMSSSDNKQSQVPLSQLYKPDPGSWSCDQCYTRNSENSTKCICCEGPAPSTITATTKSTASSETKSDKQAQVPLSQLFKPAPGSWACDQCYTRNSENATKCTCCEGPAPSTVSAPSTTAKSSLSEMFKRPTGSWECGTCYIVNSSINNYCEACDTPKDPSMPPKPKSTGFNLGLGANMSNLGFSFGIPKDSSKDTSSSKFVFPGSKDDSNNGATTPMKFEVPKKPENTTFTFGIPERPWTPPKENNSKFEFGSPGKSFDFQFQAKSPVKSPGGDAENSEEEVAESEDVYFAPIIPLPDKIEVKTGEENEEILYSHRAKLFRFDSSTKEWKERGLGDIKLLRHRETKKLRLIMRRDQILKLCLNHYVASDMEFKLKDEKTWLWNAADFSDGEIEYMQFACRFKNSEIAESFKKAVDEAKNQIEDSQQATKSSSSSSSLSSKDIEVLYEIKVTAEEKAAALELQLPENFYAYKQKEDCPGCLGCKEPDVPIFQDSSAQRSTNSQSSDSNVDNSRVTVSEKITTNEPAQTPTSIFSTSPIKPSTLATGNIFGGSSMSFGKGTSSGFTFGSPSVKETTEPKQSNDTDSVTSLADNLKICTPNTGFKTDQQSATSKFSFGGNVSEKSFGEVTSAFGTNKTESRSLLFGTGGAKTNEFPVVSANKPPADDKPTPPSTVTNIFSGLASSSTNSMTKTASNFGSFTGFPIFGSNATQSGFAVPQFTNSSSTPTTTPIFGTPSDSNKSVLTSVASSGFPSKSTFGNASMTFGTDNTTTTNVFSNKPPQANANDTPAKEEGVSFLPATDGFSFAAFAAKAPQQEAFKSDPNFSFAGAGSSVFGSKQSSQKSSSPPKKEQSEKKDDDEKENCEDNENGEGEHDPYFEPIVPLPEAIEVRTGEEEEVKVFSERAKLYRFDSATKEWKERGVGEMKILHHEAHGTYRLLLRREQVHKVVCNFLLKPDISFSPLKTSDRAYVWAGMNYTDDNHAPEELAVKFKSAELAEQFMNAIQNAQQAMRDAQIGTGEKYIADDEEYEEDDDEEIDEFSLVFEKRATVYEADWQSHDANWKLVGLGSLGIYYDSNIFGERIIFKADETGEIFSNTIICMETELKINGKECVWTAFDHIPRVRRTLQAVFSSTQAAEEMYKEFQEAKEMANQSEISEYFHEILDDERQGSN